MLGIVRPSPEYRRAILRSRFLIGAHHRPEHLDSAMREAGDRFVADMARQGWEFLGRMALAGGPYVPTPIPTSIPKAPPKAARRLGEHPTKPDTYPSNVVTDMPTLLTTDTWEYEIAGAFVRPLPPIELLEDDAARLEARARRIHAG